MESSGGPSGDGGAAGQGSRRKQALLRPHFLPSEHFEQFAILEGVRFGLVLRVCREEGSVRVPLYDSDV